MLLYNCKSILAKPLSLTAGGGGGIPESPSRAFRGLLVTQYDAMNTFVDTSLCTSVHIYLGEFLRKGIEPLFNLLEWFWIYRKIE